MIVTNGTIQGKIKTGGGFDTDGNPIPASFTYGDKIPCRYTPNNNSLKGKSNGNAFIVASYSILIDNRQFDYEQIKLLDESENEVGEYSIMWVEVLDVVEAIKIVV